MFRKGLVLLLLLLGVSVQAREFPLCMYGVSRPEDIPVLKKAGFTCFQSYARDPETLAPLAAAAKKYGLKTVFHPQQIWDSPQAAQAASWPMLAWYLVDEPDVWKWSRARVQEAHQKAKETWPMHSTTLVIGQGRTRIAYYDLPDIMMVDWYPVPHLELTSFGDNVAWTKQGMLSRGAGDRPLWGVVQIFDWKEFKQYRPDNNRIGRFPTKEEIRFMSYDGIINGATGLFYFYFYSNNVPLPQANPQGWKDVQSVIKELAELRPVLEKGELLGNALQVQRPLVLQAHRYKKHTYFFLLNRSAQPQSVPAVLLEKKYKLLFGSVKTNTISPFDVWVLKR